MWQEKLGEFACYYNLIIADQIQAKITRYSWGIVAVCLNNKSQGSFASVQEAQQWVIEELKKFYKFNLEKLENLELPSTQSA